ncbi:hypothetical protein HD806DRAFT_494836 [Xylariaceae sp. AK1471]|nr:hypothetical protein HD806DRAFT_494836 [Xylariaceae sp. AK1471]
MRFSLSAATALLLASSGPLAFVSGSANPEPKPDTVPDSTPTKTARRVGARQSSPNLLGALYALANNFDLGACIPGALPLVTALPKIPGDLIKGDAVSQALSQTTRELSDVCDFSITGSSGEVFTSFLPTWYSWYNRYSDRIASIITKCPKASALVSTVEAYETCSQVVAQLRAASASASATESTGVASTTSAASGDDGANTAIPTTVPSETLSTDSPSAARETGFLGAAAAAAAGVLGVVAMI